MIRWVAALLLIAGCNDPGPNGHTGGNGDNADLASAPIDMITALSDLMLPGNCHPGAACKPNECTSGAVSCASGSPVCQAQSNLPDGTACTAGTCQSGQCVACQDGQPCKADPCHAGLTTCFNGQALCSAATTLADGTSCGAGSVCENGTCVVCSPGVACPTGSPCSDGTTVCTSSGPTCMATAKPNGSMCGTNQVCNAGNCVNCTMGQSCIPTTAVCNKGTQVCTGAPMCSDTGVPADDGTPCGTQQFCKGGQCKWCPEGSTCPLNDPCKNGQTSCTTGSEMCKPSSNKPDGLACGTDMVCKSGSCHACVAGRSCKPTLNPCHTGVTSCASGDELCTDTGTSLPNGASCGTDQVCFNGACNGCVVGQPCSTGDPCQLGKTSCEAGKSECVPAGSSTATSCGTVTKGTCSAGACQCPAGSGFYNGDCSACPATSLGYIAVDADPSVGVDAQCCGRSLTPGFGGPCRTLTYAMPLAVANQVYTVQVKGTALGNVSQDESYPLHVKENTLVGDVCIPGVSGQDVIHVETFGTVDGPRIGFDCQGHGHGAVDGVYVGKGVTANLNATIAQVKNGVHVDSGYLTYVIKPGSSNLGSITISDVSGDGILCRSDSLPSMKSTLDLVALNIARAAQHDVFASSGCVFGLKDQSVGFPPMTVPGTLKLGEAAPCASPKRDAFGIYAEGDAAVTVNVVSQISCMTQDGISLRNNPQLSSNAPKATISGITISHCGCAGVYGEVGQLTAVATVERNNHWGALQRSAAASSDPGSAILRLTGSNVLVCNSSGEPGACCVNGNCPPGANVFNNSGLVLDASSDYWADSPVQLCNCTTLQSCVCSGGQTTPPDGIDVINAPLSAGTPTTVLTNFMKLSTQPMCN